MHLMMNHVRLTPATNAAYNDNSHYRTRSLNSYNEHSLYQTPFLVPVYILNQKTYKGIRALAVRFQDGDKEIIFCRNNKPSF